MAPLRGAAGSERVLVGSRTQRSTGLVTAQGLQPERFGDRNRSERAAHFDYQRGASPSAPTRPKPPLAPARKTA